MSEFSRDEFRTLLISICEKAKPQFGISVFDEVADVVRVCESWWCVFTKDMDAISRASAQCD